MSIKSALLKPMDTTRHVKILGTGVSIRRLTARELMDYDDAVKVATEKGDHNEVARLGIGLVLQSLVTGEGGKHPAKDLPTVEELLSAHDNVSLMDAMQTIQKHSFGSMEEAEKN